MSSITKQEFGNAFYKACLAGDVKRVEKLVLHPHCSFYDFNTGFQAACFNNHLETVIFMLEYEALQSRLYVDFDAKAENTHYSCAPLVAACYGGGYDVISYLIHESYIYPTRDIKEFLISQHFERVLDIFEKDAQFNRLNKQLNDTKTITTRRKI